jgi:hypothetical protein
MRVQVGQSHLVVVGANNDDGGTWVPLEVAAQMIERSAATVVRLARMGALRRRRILGRACVAVEDLKSYVAVRDGVSAE